MATFDKYDARSEVTQEFKASLRAFILETGNHWKK